MFVKFDQTKTEGAVSSARLGGNWRLEHHIHRIPDFENRTIG